MFFYDKLYGDVRFSGTYPEKKLNQKLLTEFAS